MLIMAISKNCTQINSFLIFIRCPRRLESGIRSRSIATDAHRTKLNYLWNADISFFILRFVSFQLGFRFYPIHSCAIRSHRQQIAPKTANKISSYFVEASVVRFANHIFAFSRHSDSIRTCCTQFLSSMALLHFSRFDVWNLFYFSPSTS